VRFFVGITDRDWFDFLSRMDGLDEVNFWQPSGQQQFRALQIGEPFLFKLHSPHDYIVVGGFFSHSQSWPPASSGRLSGKRTGRGLRRRCGRGSPDTDARRVRARCSDAAGHTIAHAHIHLVPRRSGDIPCPREGVRGVIPEKRIY
jgi:hypothetical protein